MTVAEADRTGGVGMAAALGPSGLLRTGRPADSLTGHVRMHGPAPYRGGPGRLIGEIDASGLTGRGGAAFPTGRKLAAVAAGSGRPVVVANGAEGEPASRKDKHLLAMAPHLVLDGLQLAAEAVGAQRAYLYVHLHGLPLGRLRDAMAERAAAGADVVPVQLIDAPARFLAGEESALVSSIGGGSGLPRFTPPRVFERGVGGAPTLVQNVETLAHVALIARYGAAWFRQAGTPAEPGTMLVTWHRADGSSGVSELEIGTPVRIPLRLADWPAAAVLTGGYHGAWISGPDAAALPLSASGLRAVGGVLGAGVLAALPAGRCGLAETAMVARYLAAESAGQCGPCLAGLPRIASALGQLAGPRPDAELIERLARWSGLVVGRGACHHPDGTVRFVSSALTTFAAEIRLHRGGGCTAVTASGIGTQASGPIGAEPCGCE